MKDNEKLRNNDLSIWWSLKIKFVTPASSVVPCRTVIVRTRDHEDHHEDDAHPKGESSAKRQKTYEHESRKERLSLPTPKKPTLVYHSCQSDPKAPLMTLLNQDLIYVKYGNSGPKKYTLSLHKYPTIPFPKNDIEEQTSRWVSKRIRRFNVYAQYSVEHKKNLWAKQDHIGRQKQLRDKPKEVYLESKIIKLGIESYQQKVNLTAPTITFPGIERKKQISITSELVIGMIYENSKKEKRVMIHKEIHKFCDATLKRVL
nr:hypothetical protein [Tanacetum cinerariifolium]